MEMPDITPAQIKADVIFVVGIAATLGFKVDGNLSDSIAAAFVGAFALAKGIAYGADMLIRKHRAQNADVIIKAKKQ